MGRIAVVVQAVSVRSEKGQGVGAMSGANAKAGMKRVPKTDGMDPMDSLDEAAIVMAAMDDPGTWWGWVVYLLESLESQLVATQGMYEVAQERREAETAQYDAMLVQVSNECLARVQNGWWYE